MDTPLQIPESLAMTFNRVLKRLPTGKQNDIELQKSLLLFIKLGGERLAQAWLKPHLSPFPDDISIVKARPLHPMLESDDEDEVDSDEMDMDDDDSLSEEKDDSLDMED